MFGNIVKFGNFFTGVNRKSDIDFGGFLQSALNSSLRGVVRRSKPVKNLSGLPRAKALAVTRKCRINFGLPKKKSAFTLAEVLITLVVIGVVAAITVPTMMVNHQKEQTVTQLKKVYSDLCGAVNMSEALNGSRQHWDYSISGHDFFFEYLTPYISLSKEKKSNVQNEDGIIYRECSGNPETGLLSARDSAYIVTLASGVQIFAGTQTVASSAQGKDFIIDINGQKKPNKFGRDLFHFVIYKDWGVMPYRVDDGQNPSIVHKTRDQLRNGPSSYRYQCNKQGRGMWCAALIMADGWQIKDDYPW